jgi:hypothetical protein
LKEAAPKLAIGKRKDGEMFGILRDSVGNAIIIPRYIIQMWHGPNWDPNLPFDQQKGTDAHLLYFGALILNGTALLAGPYITYDGAYVVLNEKKVTSYEQAVKIMKKDPWSINGVSVAVVRTWLSNPVLPWGGGDDFRADMPTAGELEALRKQTAGGGRSPRKARAGGSVTRRRRR